MNRFHSILFMVILAFASLLKIQLILWGKMAILSFSLM